LENNTAYVFRVSLGRPVGSTQKRLPHTLLHTVFETLIIVFFHGTVIESRTFSISEINISQSYTSSNAITVKIVCVSITLPQGYGLGQCWFHTEIRWRQFAVRAYPFISVCFIRTSSSPATIVSPWKSPRLNSRPCARFHIKPCVSFGQRDSRSN